MATIAKYVSSELRDKFEFYNYNHALEILTEAYPTEWHDLCDALDNFLINEDEISESGGAESSISQKFDDSLYPRRWKSVKIEGDLYIEFYDKIPGERKYEEESSREEIIRGFIDPRRVDYLKDRVAIMFEWNSKDTTFDRDLQALRAFYDANIISAAVVITRSANLADVFKDIKDETGRSVNRKYTGSTTCIPRLIPRLDSRQNGGCPVVAIGITKECVDIDD